MPKYAIVHERHVHERHRVVIEAESESAARQAWIDGLDTESEELDVTDGFTSFNLVPDDTPLTEEALDPVTRTVWFATVDHEHGTNDYAGATQAEVEAQVVEFCREYADHEGVVLSGDTDRDQIASYFEQVEHEFYDLRHFEVKL